MKKLLTACLALYSWALGAFAVILSQELKLYDITATISMISVHIILASFATFYSAFCYCNIDLMDSEIYPVMYSFFICIIGLSVPAGFGIVALLVILIDNHLGELSLISKLFVIITCASWAIGAVGLTIYVVTKNVMSALKERQDKLSKEKYESKIQRLKDFMGVGRPDFKLFAETLKMIIDANALLSKLELWYLTEFLSLKLTFGHDPELGKMSSSLAEILPISVIPDECTICQTQFPKQKILKEVLSQIDTSGLEGLQGALPQGPDQMVVGVPEEESLAIVMPVCKHVYHAECISRWLELSLLCPMCKSNVRTNLTTHFENVEADKARIISVTAGITSTTELRSPGRASRYTG